MAAKDNQADLDTKAADAELAAQAETDAAAKLKAETDAAAKLKAEADAAAQAETDAAAKLKAEADAAAQAETDAAAEAAAKAVLTKVTATVMDLRDPFKGSAVEEDNWLRVGVEKEVEVTPWLQAQITAKYATVGA